MAYNNYFPAGYQPYPQQQYQQQTQSGGIIWVVGENGADSYLVAPGQTVQIFDSTAPVFYLKSADNMGRPSKRVFDYTERGYAEKVQNLPQSDFATKEDISLIKDEIEALRAKFKDMEGEKK